MIFIGLPFVVRTVQPVLQDTEKELEEAASSLGAGRWQIFTKVILPSITPALLTGFAMAFARAVGEYGSVIFIAGNVPMVSEITPLIADYESASVQNAKLFARIEALRNGTEFAALRTFDQMIAAIAATAAPAATNHKTCSSETAPRSRRGPAVSSTLVRVRRRP